jgi:hypothetical protein
VVGNDGSGWLQVVTSRGAKGLVPENFITVAAAASAVAPDAAAPGPDATEQAAAIADFAATESYMAR